jgi:hypothetical protein
MKQISQIVIVIAFLPLLYACSANPATNASTENGLIASEASTLLQTDISATTDTPLLFDTLTPIVPGTNTPISYLTDTTVPQPTDTSIPKSTDTSIPIPTDTTIPIPTDTMIPATSAPVSTQEPQTSGCPNGCTSQIPDCNIKGNISTNTGEKIYHLPGMEYYTRTKISPENGERWFCTEAEAVANGWRKAKTN